MNIDDLYVIDDWSQLEAKIKMNAYYRWLNDGKPMGRDMEFWLQAFDEEMRFPFTVGDEE